MAEPIRTLSFHYAFTLADGTVRRLEARLDGRTLSLLPGPSTGGEEWTRLTYSQCPNCPLKESENPRCPVAANLTGLVAVFRDSVSFAKAEIEVVTEARRYSKSTTVMDGLSSLIGLCMVTSGCPILDKLRPMVRTHLPFATSQETLLRALGTYLTAQYFLARAGKEPDWDLKRLGALSQEIQTVNQTFSRRLQKTAMADATLNAVAQLDCFANLTGDLLRNRKLDEIEPFFAAYLS